MVRELDAGNPHVQFDEGVQETCDSATRLCPTLPERLASLVKRVIFVLTLAFSRTATERAERDAGVGTRSIPSI
jgi:hypothetical protein